MACGLRLAPCASHFVPRASRLALPPSCALCVAFLLATSSQQRAYPSSPPQVCSQVRGLRIAPCALRLAPCALFCTLLVARVARVFALRVLRISLLVACCALLVSLQKEKEWSRSNSGTIRLLTLLLVVVVVVLLLLLLLLLFFTKENKWSCSCRG